MEGAAFWISGGTSVSKLRKKQLSVILQNTQCFSFYVDISKNKICVVVVCCSHSGECSQLTYVVVDCASHTGECTKDTGRSEYWYRCHNSHPHHLVSEHLESGKEKAVPRVPAEMKVTL